MLNEKRVKHMVKLASYEGKDGAEEIKIYSYFRKDYVGYNVLISLLWITLGYLALIGMICLALVERILENLSFTNAVALIAAVVVGYILVMLLYGVGVARSYIKKHQHAKNHVKKYLRDLEILERMYEREEA